MRRVQLICLYHVEPQEVELKEIQSEPVNDIIDEYGKKQLRKVENSTMVGMIDLRGRAISNVDNSTNYTYTASTGTKPEDSLVIHADRSLVAFIVWFDCRVSGT